jgi:hypothetical protein
MTTLIRNPRMREGLGNFILVFLSVGIVILYSSYQRPIWIDEYLQIAFAAFEPQSLVGAFVNSMQTGAGGWTNFAGSGFFYSAVQYPGLQIDNLAALAIRFPSQLAALGLLLAGAYFIKSRGFSFVWQVLVVFALAGSLFLMYYGGEARSYMGLALGGVLALIIASKETTTPNAAFTFFALVVVILASANHTYFFVYLFTLSFFYLATSLYEKGVATLRTYAWRFLISLLLVSFGVTFILSPFGPLGFVQEFDYDPFQFMSPEGGLMQVLADTHVQFLPIPAQLSVFFWVALCGALLVAAVLRFRTGGGKVVLGRALGPPLMLMVVAMALSGFLSLVAWRQGYWILNRQWVASLALVPIGTVWFLAALYTYLKPRVKWAAYGLAAASFLVIGAMAAYRLYSQVGALQSYAATAAEYREKYAGVTIADSQRLYDELGPVEAANVNIYLGGPVWPVFSCFYGCEEGYQDRSR